MAGLVAQLVEMIFSERGPWSANKTIPMMNITMPSSKDKMMNGTVNQAVFHLQVAQPKKAVKTAIAPVIKIAIPNPF